MMVLLGIIFGLVFAWFAAGHGFYAMWAVLVNVVIAMYVAIMLTPMAVEIILGEDASPYAHAGFIGGITAVVFVILHTLAITFLTGTFEVSLPKIFNNIGAGLLGFITGMILWGLVCFILLVMPVRKDYFGAEFNLAGDLERMSQLSVCRTCRLVNVLSRQSNSDAVHKAMDMSRGIKGRSKIDPNEIAEPVSPDR